MSSALLGMALREGGTTRVIPVALWAIIHLERTYLIDLHLILRTNSMSANYNIRVAIKF